MTTAAQARAKLAGKAIWVWHYMHSDWQWEAARAWHVDRYTLAVQEALDLMQRDPEFCYYFDTESEMFDPVARRLGPRLEELKQRVREGRVRIVSAQVANCRPTQVGDETYLRNLQLGRAYFEAALPPTDISQFHSVDIAIGGSQMPQVLALTGFKYYRAWRPHGAMNAHRIPHQFWWQSEDGSRVLVTRGLYGGLYLPNPAFDAWPTDWDSAVVAFYDEYLKDQLLNEERSPSGQLWVTQGMDDGRPMRRHGGDEYVDLLGFMAEWRKRETVPIRWCTPQEYHEAVEANGASLATLTGVLDGCDCAYNASMGGANGLWRWRQMNDRRLLRAEWWNAAACAWLGSAPARAELLKLWRQHVTYHAHAQEAAFSDDREALVDLARDVRFHAERIEREALEALAQAAGGGSNTTRYLFNPHPWPVQAEVEVFHPLNRAGINSVSAADASGAPLACQTLREFRHPRFAGSLTDATLLVRAELPPLGFKRIELCESAGFAPAAAANAPESELTAAGLTLTFRRHALREVRDASGAVYSSRDGAPWPALRFHALDNQDWFSIGPELRREAFEPVESAWLQTGPLRWQHRALGTLGPWQAQVDTVIGAREREITFHIRLEGHWHEAPMTGFVTLLADIPAGGDITVDVPFSTEPRDPDHEFYHNSLPMDVEVGDLGIGMFERQRPGFFWGRAWCDWSAGKRGLQWLSVDGNYYFFKEPGCLGPIVARALARYAGTWEAYCADESTGSGVHEFTYALRLHDGDWRAVDPQRRSQELRHPPVVARPYFPADAALAGDASLLTLSDNALLSACYAEGNALVVRFYEREGRGGAIELGLGFACAGARAEDLRGHPLEVPLSLEGRTLRVTARPRQIITLRLERAGN